MAPLWGWGAEGEGPGTEDEGRGLRDLNHLFPALCFFESEK